MASAVINVATATTTHLIPVASVPATAFIRVLGYTLIGGGTGNATLQDSSGTALTGPMPLSATAGVVDAYDPINGVFDLAPGKGLDLLTSAAVQVSGHVEYAIKGL